PPYWMTWWFRLLAAASIAAAAFATHRYDLERKLQLERLRTRIAHDLHDDLGASLSRVALLSELASRQNPGASRRFSEIAEVARLVDDGRGFNAAGADGAGGNGLRNLQARAAALGGSLEIDSAPGEGTRLTLRFPLAQPRRSMFMLFSRRPS